MVFWEIIKWLARDKQKYAHPDPKEAYKQAITVINKQLLKEARQALKILEEAYNKEQRPDIKSFLRETIERTEFQFRIEYPHEVHPGYLILTVALAEAIKKNKHRDLNTLIPYIAKTLYEASYQFLKSLPAVPKYSYVTPPNMLATLQAVLSYHRDLRPHLELVTKLIAKTYKDIEEELWSTSPEMAHQKYEKLVREELGLDWWDLSPEEILEGRRRPKEEKPSGGPVLARPDRYPTLTQKILLKTLILGEHLRENNKGVHRDLYRALRDLLTTPLTTSNWYPYLIEWFENLEKGQHISPLTQIIQKLPIHPSIKQEAYRYLAHVEQGKPLSEIPEEEKRAFKRVMEQIKQAIWLNPERFAPVLEQLAYATGMNPKDAVKALVGIIDDLAKVYAGEKSPRQVGIERDATQVYHTIKNLQDRGNYIDPYQLSTTLTNIIEQHIQDPLLKEAYKQAIKHYQETHHQIPRNLEYLEKIIEKERELEEKLKQLAHGDRKLTDLEVRRIAMLYRTLMLLTPHPTLEETRRFYSQLTERLKVRVENEEFIPIHGPIAAEVALSFQRIIMARSKSSDYVARMEMVGYEPLFYTTPHLAEKVESLLSGLVGDLVPLDMHQDFILFISRSQTRSPLEKFG